MSHGRFPFEKLSKYPHMKPEDVAVWERFIKDAPDFFDSVDYDYHVGKGRPYSLNLPENIARSAKKLSQRKVDVIGYKDDAVYVVEVKPIADMRALGQTLVYFKLYIERMGTAGNVFKLVIAGDIEPDLAETYKEMDVSVMLV